VAEHNAILGPWFIFQANGHPERRWCQPDAMIVNIRTGLITLVEIKLRHTSLAWWQLRHLYTPVIRTLFPAPNWEIAMVEIVRWFDPNIAFPERFKMLPDLTKVTSQGFHVHIRGSS